MGFDWQWWQGIIAGIILLVVGWIGGEFRAAFKQSTLPSRLVAFRKGRRMLSLALFIGGGALLGFALWAFVGTIRPDEANANQVALPAVSVTPKEEPSDYYLAVENRGGPAKFYAEIEIVDRPSKEIGERAVYPAVWEDGSGSSKEIATGLQGRLQIGTEVPSLKTSFLRVCYFNSRNNEIDYVTEEIRNPSSPPLIILRVKISSIPAMKDGPFVREYWLSSHSLGEAPGQ